MKKHVFLVQAHRDPILLERILKRLMSGNHYFIVNIDGKSMVYSELLESIASIKNVISVTNMKVQHGGFSQIECTLNQMKLAQSYGFDYCHTISGQDYPCVNAEKFDAFFEFSERNYVKFDSDEEIAMWRYSKYLDRMQYWYFDDVVMKLGGGSFVRNLARIISFFANRFAIRKCDIENVWGGWNWFSLRYDLIDYILKYVDGNPEFVRKFKYTSCGDELFFLSIIKPVCERYKVETQNSLRFIEWHPKRATKSLPLVLCESEFIDIMNSRALFCRKVDIDTSAGLMNMLDLSVHGNIA